MENKQDNSIIKLAAELRWKLGDNVHDKLTESLYADASDIASKAIEMPDQQRNFTLDSKIDRIVTSKRWGFPLMIGILGIILWLTITGANYPSGLLFTLLIENLYPALKELSSNLGLFSWLDGLLIDGIYLAVAWVVSVMLPPMAIFFPYVYTVRRLWLFTKGGF